MEWKKTTPAPVRMQDSYETSVFGFVIRIHEELDDSDDEPETSGWSWNVSPDGTREDQIPSDFMPWAEGFCRSEEDAKRSALMIAEMNKLQG